MAAKTPSAKTALATKKTDTKKTKKSDAVVEGKRVKAETAAAASAGEDRAKEKSAKKSVRKKGGSPAPSRAKGPKKTTRQSLAQPAAPATVPTAMMGVAAPEALVAPLRRVKDMGVVAGTVDGKNSPTRGIDAGATDLCEVVPSGRIAVAGDTWKGPRALGPRAEWTPSLALHIRSLAGAEDRVEFDDQFGWRNLYAEGWRDYDPDTGEWGPDTGLPTSGRSQLPAGTVQIGDKEYLMVTRTEKLVAKDSRLVQIDTEREGWQTVAGSERPASYQDFNQTQISGCLGHDGWVYIVADDFHRQKPVVLYRCRPETFTDRESWQGWGKVNGDPRKWDWGQKPEPLRWDWYGELSLRFIEGKYVLSAFNDKPWASSARPEDQRRRIEVHIADPKTGPNIITQILRTENPLPWTTVVDESQVPYLYGGYIVPGSTLQKMRILVSQWAQGKDCPLPFPYDVREYEINLTQ